MKLSDMTLNRKQLLNNLKWHRQEEASVRQWVKLIDPLNRRSTYTLIKLFIEMGFLVFSREVKKKGNKVKLYRKNEKRIRQFAKEYLEGKEREYEVKLEKELAHPLKDKLDFYYEPECVTCNIFAELDPEE